MLTVRSSYLVWRRTYFQLACSLVSRQVIILEVQSLNPCYVWCEIALRWMPQNTFDDKSALVHVMALCCQAISHYLSQCWPRSVMWYGVTRPRWVNISGYFDCKIKGKFSEALSIYEIHAFWAAAGPYIYIFAPDYMKSMHFEQLLGHHIYIFAPDYFVGHLLTLWTRFNTGNCSIAFVHLLKCTCTGCVS